MRTCRACGTVRTAGDPCPGADCPARNRPPKLRSKSPPITATAKHGFHAPNVGRTSLVADYDMPIRARRWRAA